MPSLAETQVMLKRAIVDGDAAAGGLIAHGAAARLEIHAAHFRNSLARVLARTFPAVVSLVDERFFAYCARAFVEAQPPTRPCLFEYGGTFPAFLAAFEPCAALTYLPDVARLEWDMHAVFHDLPADRDAPERWLAPGVRIADTAFPIHEIWRVARGLSDGPVDLGSGGAALIVYRDGPDVTFETLSPAAFAFLSEIRVARSDTRALMTARAIDPTFHAAREIPAAAAAQLRLGFPPHSGDETHA